MEIKKAVSTGQKKTAKARATCTSSKCFNLKINNVPLNLVTDDLMKSKFNDLITKVGLEFLGELSFEITTRGGGSVSRIYAARQAFAKCLVSYYANFLEAWNKQEIQNRIVRFDKYALVADPRRTEPKKYGGPGARARYQKSYR